MAIPVIWPFLPQSVGNPMWASSTNLGSNSVSHPNLIKRALPRCSPYGTEMHDFSRLWGQTVPRHANNSQIIQEVVKGVWTQTEATPDPMTGQRSGSSFSFLIYHHSNIRNSSLNETIYRFYFFFFFSYLEVFLFLQLESSKLHEQFSSEKAYL